MIRKLMRVVQHQAIYVTEISVYRIYIWVDIIDIYKFTSAFSVNIESWFYNCILYSA